MASLRASRSPKKTDGAQNMMLKKLFSCDMLFPQFSVIQQCRAWAIMNDNRVRHVFLLFLFMLFVYHVAPILLSCLFCFVSGDGHTRGFVWFLRKKIMPNSPKNSSVIALLD